MWICKLFGHKFHEFTDGMRALFCERCGERLYNSKSVATQLLEKHEIDILESAITVNVLKKVKEAFQG